MADAPDLGSGEKSWGFKSLLPHHIRTHEHFVRGFFVVCTQLFTQLTTFQLAYSLPDASFLASHDCRYPL
jgi:hypothetical protein